MSSLDDLLNRIDPARTIDQCNALMDRALNSFTYPGQQIGNYEEFKAFIGDFYWHVDRLMLGVGQDFTPDADIRSGFGMGLLDEIYGPRGSAAAFSMASSGVEGGLYGVCKKMGEALAARYSKKHIDHEVGRFINELRSDFDLYRQTVKEYVQKFGRLLPPEALENNASHIMIHFGQVLENHPYLIKRMRQIGKF